MLQPTKRERWRFDSSSPHQISTMVTESVPYETYRSISWEQYKLD